MSIKTWIVVDEEGNPSVNDEEDDYAPQVFDDYDEAVDCAKQLAGENPDTEYTVYVALETYRCPVDRNPIRHEIE